MFQLKDNQVCSRCGNQYGWIWTELERHGDNYWGRLDEQRKNVKNCTRINNTDRYSLELECPDCGRREIIERSRP